MIEVKYLPITYAKFQVKVAAVLDRARHDIEDTLKTALFIAVAIEIERSFSSS